MQDADTTNMLYVIVSILSAIIGALLKHIHNSECQCKASLRKIGGSMRKGRSNSSEGSPSPHDLPKIVRETSTEREIQA